MRKDSKRKNIVKNLNQGKDAPAKDINFANRNQVQTSSHASEIELSEAPGSEWGMAVEPPDKQSNKLI